MSCEGEKSSDREGIAGRTRLPHLMLWTRRLSIMVDSGVALFSCLVALEEEESSGPLREISGELRRAVEGGETLSQAMSARPELFYEDYIASVRAGEVGGILDQAMRRLGERMEAGLSPPRCICADLIPRGELAEWCWRFGHMLTAGVPLLYALGTLAEMGHPALREITRQMRDEVAAGSPLALTRAELQAGKPRPVAWRYPGVFGSVLRNLLTVGANHGLLTQTLERSAAELDWEARLEAQGHLPPLSARPAEPTADVRAAEVPEAHPVVREVNDMFKQAFRIGGRYIKLDPTGDFDGCAVVEDDAGPMETIPLADYDQVVRRIKIMADINPFVRREGEGYIKGTIHIRHGDQQFAVTLRSMGLPRGDHLHLVIRKDTEAMEL